MEYLKIVLASSILLIFIQGIKSQTYKIENKNYEIQVTKETLNKLSIPIRNNILKDSPITIIVNKQFSLFDGSFIKGKNKNDIINYNTDSAYLKNPIIEISPLINSIYFEKKDTVLEIKARAESALIHEIAHYLLSAYDDKNYYAPKDLSKPEMEKYISQPMEFGAFAAEAYTYFKRTKNKKLKNILNIKASDNDKIKTLIIEYYKSIYPWREELNLKIKLKEY